jgi:hypothetical protein
MNGNSHRAIHMLNVQMFVNDASTCPERPIGYC